MGSWDAVALRVAGAVLPLTVLAGAGALLAPSAAVAQRTDLLLAALVLVTALGIEPHRLRIVRERPGAVIALSVAPFAVLTPAAWGIGRAFSDGPVRDGVLALGLAPTEVAAVGLVALAGGSAALALAALTGSLIVCAVWGPLAAGLLADGEVDVAPLLGRFALVVLLPLAAGLVLRALAPRLSRAEPTLAALSTVTVAALAYGALASTPGAAELARATAAGGLFLAASALVAWLWARRTTTEPAVTGLAVSMRDFAVAATLATQAFGPRAGTVAGVYGVLMLVFGAAVAGVLRRRVLRPPGQGAAPAA
jgi:predicted Na+-dependent transporter